MNKHTGNSLTYDTLLYKDMENDLKEESKRRRKKPKARKVRKVRRIKTRRLEINQIPDAM